MTDREPDSQPKGDGGPLLEEVPQEPDMDQLMDRLEQLEGLVDDPRERQKVRETMSVARRMPVLDAVERGIKKYTARDMAEAFVGSILLSLPLLVEGGVFEIAAHLAETTVARIPVFLVSNVLFILLLTIGLLYWTDIREVTISKPIFGIIPRRLVGVLLISFLTALGMMAMWGRLYAEDPTTVEAIARVTVVWAAGAFGAALGDILPGESAGHDVTIKNLDDIVLPEE